MSPTDTLAVTLDAPDSVRAGEPVPVTISITNQSGRSLTLHLQGREIVFDVTVSREDGIPVWRRLAGAAVQAILRVEQLEAGGEIILRATWSQQDATGKPVRPGTYYLQGSVPTDGDPLVTPPRELKIS